jgi:methionyl aminopeptidase
MTDALKTLRRAGQIARDARDLGAKLIVPGARLRDVVVAVEDEIVKRGGRPAFPAQTSVNHVAAHDCPGPDDSRVYREGDVAKLDIGVHIDGYVVDTATTVNVGASAGVNGRLIEAARQALAAAIRVARPGLPVVEVSSAIEGAIRGAGFRPLDNLCGHGVGRWVVHAPPAITNTVAGASGRLPTRGVIAIEPFATTGPGASGARGTAEVFRLPPASEARLADVPLPPGFADALKAWKGLPVARRYFSSFGDGVVSDALQRLEKARVLHSYPPLVELSGAPVAQAEHSVYLGPEGAIQLT